jgi:hypothetical protein
VYLRANSKLHSNPVQQLLNGLHLTFIQFGKLFIYFIYLFGVALRPNAGHGPLILEVF